MNDGTWARFAAENAEMAEAGMRLLYQEGDSAAAFLATVAPDGGPRLHPIFPVVAEGELWLFIVNMSPKYRDLLRNGRFALHSMLTPAGGEEFYVRGRAEPVTEPATRRLVAAAAGRPGEDFEALFRCEIESVLLTAWADWGTPQTWPSYMKWRA